MEINKVTETNSFSQDAGNEMDEVEEQTNGLYTM